MHLGVLVAGLHRTAPPGAGLAFLGAPKGDEDMTYIAPHDICRDADGNIVDCDRPQGAFLLIAEGGRMPIAEARKYGLVQDDDAPAEQPTAAPTAVEEKSVPQAPEDKSVKSSSNKRRGAKAEVEQEAAPEEASTDASSNGEQPADVPQSDQAADSDEKGDGE